MRKYGEVRQATDANTIWRVPFACWINKATDTHLEYVILIVFPLLQRVGQRSSILLFTLNWLSFLWAWLLGSQRLSIILSQATLLGFVSWLWHRYSSSQTCPAKVWGLPASYSMCTWDCFPVGKATRAWSYHTKSKAIPLKAWSGPEGYRKLWFPDFMTTAQEGGKVVSLMHRPHLPPGNPPGTHFC